MEIWPYPYNTGKKAWLGTNDATRLEQPNLAIYNTRDGVTGTTNTLTFSFQIFGANETVRQTIGAVYIACSVNTASWGLTYNTAKAVGSLTPFATPNTNPVTYQATKDITTPAITDDFGKQVRYDRANIQGIFGTEINLSITSVDPPGAIPRLPPVLYYAYFTGHRTIEIDQFTQIRETYLDPGLRVRENLYGGLNKSRLVNARRRWRTEYETFISANTAVSFRDFFTFLRRRNQSDSFLFGEDFERYPDRIYPAVITNQEEVFNYLGPTKSVYQIPLTIEEV